MPHTYALRGIVYTSMGNRDRAIQDYDEAIQRDPKNAHAYAARGLAYAMNGDYDRVSESWLRLREEEGPRPRHPGLRPGDPARP